VGGGLAGLGLSIQLGRMGHRVLLLEKEEYPFHKVCGEYISLESWDFLSGLGIDLPALHVSEIKKLQVSSPQGTLLEQALPLGGFGISRYLLDNKMAALARDAGVVIRENTKVTDIRFGENDFIVEESQHAYRARVACGSYGKRSNLDIKWKRSFITTARNKLNNYVGVKYHVQCDFPADTIALHTFSGGYCGVVRIEGDKYCLCYLTTAANLQKSGGDILKMEESILCTNPHLKKVFTGSRRLYGAPLAISQISFESKSQVEDHVLMIGDAAGMITPLCGNGMSMALHGSKIAAEIIHRFLEGNMQREEMESMYTDTWRKTFEKRLAMGRRIQRLFGNAYLTALAIRASKIFPFSVRWLIKQTHGNRF
jgi:menaquinone-9 beta-reductase